MMTVLIVGGNGFIGRELKATLEHNAHTVWVADRGQSDIDRRFLSLDVSSLEATCTAIDILRPRVVVHLAFLLADDANEPDLRFRVNVAGTQNVFEACHRASVERCVYASSIAVYGDQKYWGGRKVTEDDFPRPVNSYGWHKVVSEVQANEYARSSSTDFVGLRVSTVYGPGRATGLSAPFTSMIRAGLNEARVETPFAESEELNVVHVEDVASSITTLVEANSLNHNIYNSGGETLTIGKLAAHLKVLRPEIDFRFGVDGGLHIQNVSRVDWAKLRREFGLTRSTVFDRIEESRHVW